MEPVIPRWHLGAVRRAVSKSASDLVSLRVPSYAEHVVGDDESGYSLGGYDCDLLSFIEWSRGIRVVADLDDVLAETEGMVTSRGGSRRGAFRIRASGRAPLSWMGALDGRS